MTFPHWTLRIVSESSVVPPRGLADWSAAEGCQAATPIGRTPSVSGADGRYPSSESGRTV